MRKGYQLFSGAGLAVAAVAVALTVWLGGGADNPRSSLIAAAALAIGDVAAALWAAGAAERAQRLMMWARVGLAAAIMSFVGLWLIVIPLAFFALASGAANSGVAFAVALIAGALLVWATHRLAWRRVAPKAGA